MLDLEAIKARTKNLRTFNDADRWMVDAAHDDINDLLDEVEALRVKVDLYTKHARMDARRAAR